MLFFSTLLKHGRHFYYRNQPLNMRMRVCYLDRHEAGLCCYLVIHIENLITSITAVLLPFVTHSLTLPPNLENARQRAVFHRVKLATHIHLWPPEHICSSSVTLANQ
jgi:hypothetical protein